MTHDDDIYMPEGVQTMSKQQLWNWFSRWTECHAQGLGFERSAWSMFSGLHGAYLDGEYIRDGRQVLDIQRNRIRGLEQHQREMHRGYDRKIKRLEKRILELEDQLGTREASR